MGNTGHRPDGFPTKSQSYGILCQNKGSVSGPDRCSCGVLELSLGLRFSSNSYDPQDPEKDKEGARSGDLHCPSMAKESLVLGSPLHILGCVAKGSLGPILKVLNCSQQKVFAVKVLPKGEILRRNTLKQCKEEVTIQRHVKHPFIQSFEESWQGQSHLFIMCSYCSFGDLYSLWSSAKFIDEDTVRIFATELVTVLAYLHDLGIIHRDLKMENILLDERGHLKLTDFGFSRQLSFGEHAYTICGTLQYMAPEVLSGGPYNHSADWWSLGILLYALATGKFPVVPEKDHIIMLQSVNQAEYNIPVHLSHGLTQLLVGLLCKVSRRRLRYLYQFKLHPFFKGMPFDPVLLQKLPLDLVLSMRKSELTNLQEISVFEDFDWESVLTFPHPV
ncbi:hypothetical protein GDO86_003177 [Hymenochirus boettgeri]|uniref:Protein kinase domain-containing protein n=1 Tax=Hymenochirus boettgeri TaxID=247094 RepID=A0A8T2K8G9_9PIPI|nr:hypothetical protein GDO86_003177 [Hymenochirus boettgeri]